ncbi:MAG TPA: phospholipase D family protein [Ktedonobacteraceae bacterium]|nr:phospholipase D family protein [Ktedonobacteraceae bacterium]
MSKISDARLQQRWWATGDTPVRTDSRVAYLVDGRTAMLTMCLHFIKASKYIYLANWGMTPGMELVRGTDRVAGPEGSPEQQALLAQLREQGFSQADIAFWSTHALSVQAVLGYAVSKGVEVKVLLWAAPELFSHYDPQGAHDQLTKVGVACLLDDSSHGILHHPAESLHQKISIVDGTHAFVGGVDPLIERGGEFDRWDTPRHVFSSLLRRTHDGHSPHPWHDAHSLIEGPAAGDVELNFRQRWNDVVQRRELDADLVVLEHPLAPPLPSQSLVQVARTIPQHTYNFTPQGGIQGIAQLYANALSNIQRFVYLENQYLWLRAFTGLDVALAGFDSPDMEVNLRKLSMALNRGAAMTIILPDHPNVGRAFTDAAIMWLRTEAPQAVTEGRLQAFTLATDTQEGGKQHHRPIYVHAKVGIVDDIWATVGSANLNNRGMRDDAEMNVATLDPDLAHGLRLMLQGEHLDLIDDLDLFVVSRLIGQQHQSAAERKRALGIQEKLEDKLGDPFIAMRLLHERAWENLQCYKSNQPLIGHLLPYLTGEEAQKQGLNFREEHGWLEEP